VRALAWVALFLIAAGCGDSSELKLCGEIPEGGCPIGRGGSCDDVFCSALYDCKEGAWTRVVSCPGNAGGAGGGGGGSGGAAGGGGACDPVTIDHTGEKIGCKPDLQVPDCPAVAAETCVETACLSRCADFYLCKADGAGGVSWAIAAYCDADGHLVVGGR